MSQRPQRARLPAVASRCALLRALAWALTGALVRATVLVLVAVEPAGAAPDITGTWSVQTGEVSYRVRHIMHGAEGISREVRGQVTCAGGVCTLALSVPVASFVTRDPDRDRDMRAVTRAAQHPMVQVGGALRQQAGESLAGVLRIDFAGATVELPGVRVRLAHHWRSVEAAGRFDVSLRAFDIPPPALLGIPIEDAVSIEFQLTLRRG